MDDWPRSGLEDDLRPRMEAAMAQGRAFTLVTVFAAEGGPRGPGAQMVVTDDDYWGFVSGGCIEADVAFHGRATLADGQPRRLIYGRGSPWIDTRLPCGGRLDLLVERILPDDATLAAFIAARAERRVVRYRSDGLARVCVAKDAPPSATWVVDTLHPPSQKLIVVGSDPIALAIAAQGAQLGWSASLVWSGGPSAEPGFGVQARRGQPAAVIGEAARDPRCAIAIATHDQDHDEAALLAALDTDAGYIGVLGARRRIPDRLARLRAQGVADAQLARLRLPIGLEIGAATPWEIAVSVAADVIAQHRRAGALS